ncbi:MAG: hypothetical protein NTX44_03925 [Ignavibacteriales bacterium]|nr:hypothetical protein [Ignavibacteriales bacterium]
MDNVSGWFAKAYLINIFVISASFSQINSASNATDLQNAPCSLYKLSLGIGVGTMDVSGTASFAYDFSGQFLSIHAVATDEFKLFGDNPVERIGDIGILYGVSARWGKWYASTGAGISYVHSINRGKLIRRANEMFGADDYEEISRSSVGLPIQVEISVAPFSYLGVAIIGFANINSIKAYGGITFCIQIGKLH